MLLVSISLNEINMWRASFVHKFLLQTQIYQIFLKNNLFQNFEKNLLKIDQAVIFDKPFNQSLSFSVADQVVTRQDKKVTSGTIICLRLRIPSLKSSLSMTPNTYVTFLSAWNEATCFRVTSWQGNSNYDDIFHAKWLCYTTNEITILVTR